MAQAPALSNITMEAFGDLPEDQSAAFESLVGLLNPFLNDTATSLTNSLNFSENFNAKYKTITVTVPAETWTDATLLNSWLAFGGGFSNPGYMITEAGIVKLRGLAKDGTTVAGTAMFTLPVGYRPATPILFSTVIANAFGRVDITAAGNVQFTTGVGSSFVSFDGIEFYADVSGPAAAPAAFDGPDWPIAIKPEISGLPKDVRLVQIRDLSGQSSTSVGGYSPDWSVGQNGNVIIKRIGGLSPGRKYQLTFLILGE